MSQTNAAVSSVGVPSRLLSTAVERGLYALAWSVFTVGFAATFWLQARRVDLLSLVAAARVVLPAALLGIAVIRLAERVSPRHVRGMIIHALCCLAYPAIWIGIVNVVNNAIAGAVTGSSSWRFPPAHVVHWHYLAGVMIYVALSALTHGRSRVLEAERQRLWAEWQLLRGQLNPHFVFNMLHAVFGLATLEPTAGEIAIARFSRVLRHALDVHREGRELVPLRDEWRFTEDYLELETIRLDGRLTWQLEIDDAIGDVPVPALLLQPLLENVVHHSGVVDGERVGVAITARREGDVLLLRVSDDGKGSVAEAALGSSGVGLRAARVRVQQLNPDPRAFDLETGRGAGFAVTLRLPAPLAIRRAPDPLGAPVAAAARPA